jgi:hypothetical protein
MPRFLNSSFCFYLAHHPYAVGDCDILCLADCFGARNMPICLLILAIALDATP